MLKSALVNMDVSTIDLINVLIVLLAMKVTKIVGVCKVGSQVISIPYSDTIVNHTIVGPVMSSITAVDERECEMECHLAEPDLCYMFNYHPSSKVCELLYKNRAAAYKVVKKAGSTFKTRMCQPSTCVAGTTQHCVALGNQNKTLCLQFTGRIIKANTAPVCIGTRDDSYGTFFAPVDGKIKTFTLVYKSGEGVEAYKRVGLNNKGYWGTRFTISRQPHSYLELHVTDKQNARITPPPGYPVDTTYWLMRYKVPGFNVMSPEMVFPEISPPLAVTKGKEFRIWFGQDMDPTAKYEGDTSGTTCADVYVYYTGYEP